MRAVVVVPWRGGDPQREENWAYCKSWWERFGYELIVSEHPGPEPFNRSKAINDGARKAWPWDVLVTIDADVLEDQDEQITWAIIKAWETGKLTVGHTEGRDLDEKGTRSLLNGDKFDWHRRTSKTRRECNSRVNVFRADLYERIGGFDERFHGWGHEDSVMYEVAHQLHGPLEHVPGTSWHLFHRPQLALHRQTPNWQNGKLLADRYYAAAKSGGWDGVKAILDERTDDEKFVPPWPTKVTKHKAHVDLVVITSGRGEYLAKTLKSFDERVKGNIVGRLMFDDSGDANYAKHLDETYPEFTIVHHDHKLGYSPTMARARHHVKQTPGSPYVFWLEDDFTFRRDVSLDDMATLLERKELAQVVLLRAPYYAREIAKGSIPGEHPESYTREVHKGIRFMRHQRFYSSNPNLSRRSLFKRPWPEGLHTESHFGRDLVTDGQAFAFLGWNEPWVDHIGEVRGGFGY